MVDSVNWDQFLNRGCFLASPKFKKVWCMYGNAMNTIGPAIKPKNDLQSQDDMHFQDNKKLFYRNNFDCTLESPWISSGSFYECDLNQFFTTITRFEAEAPTISWSQSQHKKSQKNYEDIFKQIKIGIEKGILQKAVPFQSEITQTQLNQKNLVYFFNRLTPLLKNKNLFFYGFWDFEKQKLQFGASPELLFTKQGNAVSTIALAGTSVHPEKDFQNKKMLDEHGYVVTDLASELKKFGPVKKHRPCVVKYRNYFHKKTKLTVECSKIDPSFEDLLSSLYPSAAIGAYPRAQGMQFLKNIEQKTLRNCEKFETLKERSFFAAPFGIQLNQNFMLCISTIRGIEWDQGTMRVSAGGGVVAQSVLEDEWREICLKIESIKSIFGL